MSALDHHNLSKGMREMSWHPTDDSGPQLGGSPCQETGHALKLLEEEEGEAGSQAHLL